MEEQGFYLADLSSLIKDFKDSGFNYPQISKKLGVSATSLKKRKNLSVMKLDVFNEIYFHGQKRLAPGFDILFYAGKSILSLDETGSLIFNNKGIGEYRIQKELNQTTLGRVLGMHAQKIEDLESSVGVSFAALSKLLPYYQEIDAPLLYFKHNSDEPKIVL